MLYSVHYAVNRVPAGNVRHGDRSTCREIGKFGVRARNEQDLHQYLDHRMQQMARAYQAKVEVVAILID